jgi:hypothetical protein
LIGTAAAEEVAVVLIEAAVVEEDEDEEEGAPPICVSNEEDIAESGISNGDGDRMTLPVIFVDELIIVFFSKYTRSSFFRAKLRCRIKKTKANYRPI